jgi:hypothetical protein
MYQFAAFIMFGIMVVHVRYATRSCLNTPDTLSYFRFRTQVHAVVCTYKPSCTSHRVCILGADVFCGLQGGDHPVPPPAAAAVAEC